MFVTSLESPLRGRERELSHLRDVLAYGITEGSALLVIEGTPGSGKTRLLRACAEMAERMGYATPDRVLAVRRPAPGRVHHGHAEPLRRAAGRRTAAGARPLLLLLDEADRLGEEAIDTLLARRAALHGGRAVTVVAQRPGRGPDALGAILATPSSRREHMTLRPLDLTAAVEVAEDVLGLPPSPDLVELVDQTGGHPRLIVALVAGLREERRLGVADGEAHPIGRGLPQRLRDRVTATMDSFSPACRQLLRTAAVLGEELEYDVLAAMLRTSPAAMIGLMDEAVGTGALSSDGLRTVFRGELLRRAIAESVPASLKRALWQEAEEVRRTRGTTPARPVALDAAQARATPGDRRAEVLRLVADGLTNRQIARRLEVSPHTVNYHLRKLFFSYGVRSRIDLLRAVERQRAARLADAG
ncbi:LuxR C-terminal-related transcriptional regulator [Streptomyces sp. NPDC056049]|uniref:LuxR C-terminal-related transcriptional regulator n=1 Tax=Streptomyces sp. NPDC056049 TaxID=3345693 RepID=UPI0035DB8B65